MRTARFGPAGLDLPVLGQGTWNLERDDEREALRALEAGLDAGATHIDTAELYGNGRVESIIAPLIARRRDEIYLVSKVLPSHASYEGTIAACERSLKRLCTDRLDLYLLHWPGGTPLEDTIGAFEALVAGGKIAAYGVSNFDVDELEEAVAIAGPNRIVCNQVLYHLQERAIEHAVLPRSMNLGVAVVAYSPLGSGHFPEARSPGGQALADIAAAHGATPEQVALAFLVQRGGVFAIPKAARTQHALANAAAGDLDLGAAELTRLDTAFPIGRRRGLPML